MGSDDGTSGEAASLRVDFVGFQFVLTSFPRLARWSEITSFIFSNRRPQIFLRTSILLLSSSDSCPRFPGPGTGESVKIINQLPVSVHVLLHSGDVNGDCDVRPG